MTWTKRDLLVAAGSGIAASGMLTKTAAGGDAAPPRERALEQGDGATPVPPGWMGKEKIAFLIYPGFAPLDMVGPYEMLSGLMGATMHVVAKSTDVVKSANGLLIEPTVTFETCPADLDVLCVPGGDEGTLQAMQDEATIGFLKQRSARARFVTSVCTGSLLLGAAGLLTGYKATSHWATRSLLPVFGAIPTEGRVVRDRNRITGGGVTAGIDFGLELVGLLRDREYAECVQLMAEYAPAPPFDAGTPAKAPAKVTELIDAMFVDFNKRATVIGRAAYARSRDG